MIKIRIGWTSKGGQYVAVRDSGPGIPEEEIPIVMSSFGRGTLAQKNAEEGSGLGLPIVKGLVELHGGTFTLKSKLREGTEVIVIFPPERVMDSRARDRGRKWGQGADLAPAGNAAQRRPSHAPPRLHASPAAKNVGFLQRRLVQKQLPPDTIRAQ